VNLDSTNTNVSATCYDGSNIVTTTIPPHVGILDGSVVCKFGPVDLGTNNAAGTAELTVALSNGGPFIGDVGYEFADATENDVNRCVDINDIPNANPYLSVPGTSLVNHFCGDTDSTFPVSITIGNRSLSCGQSTTWANTATVTASNVGPAAASTSVALRAPTRALVADGPLASSTSDPLTINSGACPTGCTLTIGFYKTHAGFGPQKDFVTPLLPKLLGNSGGPKTVTVGTASQAVNILNMFGTSGVATPSNGINRLYAQLLAAKFSIARGASATAISSVITAADGFLATHNSSDWGTLNKTNQGIVNTWQNTLDNYNN